MAGERHRFDAGRISLDLMATLRDRRVERLAGPAALEAWLRAGGLAERRLRAGAGDLERARALRAALFGVVDAELQGGRPSSAGLKAINAAAAVPPRGPRLVASADGLRLAERPAPSVAELLGEIARDAIDLLAGPQRELLRECAAEDCSGIYVDASQGRTRRWCSSARCGNRARVAAHRANRREKGADPATLVTSTPSTGAEVTSAPRRRAGEGPAA